MMRTVTAGVATLVIGLLATTSSADDGGTIKLNEPLEGDIKKENTKDKISPNQGQRVAGVGAEYQIELKARQKFTVSATVEGSNRKVGLALIGIDGKTLVVSEGDRLGWGLSDKKNSLEPWTASADGTYKIVVVSDHPGLFTLKVTEVVSTEQKIQELEKKIARLKQEIKETEDKLAELRAKKKQ